MLKTDSAPKPERRLPRCSARWASSAAASSCIETASVLSSPSSASLCCARLLARKTAASNFSW